MGEQTWTRRVARRLEEAFEHFRPWAILALLLLAAAIVAGIATRKSSPGSSGTAYGIYIALLGATLLAVLWYSFETRRLVHIQRDAAELADHPWLHVAGWPAPSVLRPDAVLPFGAVLADLPISNVGHTPALLRDVSVEYERLPDSSECEVIPAGDVNPRVLVPGERVAIRLIEVRLKEQTLPRLLVNVSVKYRTIHGGSGRVMLRFRFADGVWKSRDTDYECTLSSGARLPGARLAEARH
jgi:hypothetical protein